MNEQEQRLRVAFALMPRFTLTAFSGFIDTLRLAGDEDDKSRPINCTWSVLGNRNEQITSSCGVKVEAWDTMTEPGRFDYVVVVGGLLHGGQEVPASIGPFLNEAANAKVPLIGLCTGSFVLARLGYLDGYTTCVSWFHRDEFMHEFPHLRAISNRLYVIDGNRLTSAGGTSVVHLAARLVARHQGQAAAKKSLRIMIEDHPLPGNTPQPEQVISRSARDPVVKRAMLLIEQNLSKSDELGKLSERMWMSTRQLQRRFIGDIGITAKEYRARLRLSRAKWLVQHSGMLLSEIAVECGFADSAHLSRTFRARVGTSPSQFRKQAAG